MSSSERPEFFLDRGLGRRTAEALREHGWVVQLVADHYPADGDGVDDAEWIAHGCAQGWGLLTKDKRIRYGATSCTSCTSCTGHLFCLSDGNLTVAQAVERWIEAAPRIERSRAEGPGLWMVYAGGRIERRWP